MLEEQNPEWTLYVKYTSNGLKNQDGDPHREFLKKYIL
nr:MAG TPA: hypothetical protein [Caudoviricetes sp.]